MLDQVRVEYWTNIGKNTPFGEIRHIHKTTSLKLQDGLSNRACPIGTPISQNKKICLDIYIVFPLNHSVLHLSKFSKVLIPTHRDECIAFTCFLAILHSFKIESSLKYIREHIWESHAAIFPTYHALLIFFKRNNVEILSYWVSAKAQHSMAETNRFNKWRGNGWFWVVHTVQKK